MPLIQYNITDIAGMYFSLTGMPVTPFQRIHKWYNIVNRIHQHIPLLFIHDMGIIMAYSSKEYSFQSQPFVSPDFDLSGYKNLLKEIRNNHVIRYLLTLEADDRIIGVLLARICSILEIERLAEYAFHPMINFSEESIKNAFKDYPLEIDQLLTEEGEREIKLRLQGLNIDEIRFMHHYGIGSDTNINYDELINLFHLTGLPEAIHDIISEAMSLLPNILEVKGMKDEHYYAIDGIKGIANRGSLDSMVHSELAYPDDVFYRKLVDRELLYYGRERAKNKKRDLFLVLVNTGAHMKGDPEIMSKALSLALIKKMTLKGMDFRFGFFDENVYPLGTMDKPGDYYHLLYFKSEGFTKAERVLEQLLEELKHLSNEYNKIYILIITHLFFDCDDCNEHIGLYKEIKNYGELRGVFISTGGRDESKPAMAKERFHYTRVVSSDTIHDAGKRRKEEVEILLKM